MKGKRTLEFVLGLIGGIIGIFSGIIALGLGGFAASFGVEGAETVAGLGIFGIVLAIAGIVGSILVRKKALIGGIVMIVAAVGGYLCISGVFLIPGILLLVAGLLGVFRKVQTA